MADVWECKVGFGSDLPSGSDLPMRDAIRAGFLALTGHEPEFIFSGWGATLTESQRAVVEDRLPDPDVIVAECRKAFDDVLDEMDVAQRASASGAFRKEGRDGALRREQRP